MTRFDEQVVIITGASRGIGAATAKAFAGEGAAVAVNYRKDKEGADSICEAIAADGGKAIAVRADMAEEADVTSLVDEVEQRLGPIDVLVNNAAMIDRATFLEVDLDVFEQVWRADVRGLFQISQLVAQHMVRDDRTGSIVHLSSIGARLAFGDRTAYLAAKGAVESLTRGMALDLAPHGIRVNAVAPGVVATEALLVGMPDPAIQAAVQSHVPAGRFGRPEELAAAILFLASSEASYVNGTIFHVDAALGSREPGPAKFVNRDQ